MPASQAQPSKLPVIVTGSSGIIGTAVIQALAAQYAMIGFDRPGPPPGMRGTTSPRRPRETASQTLRSWIITTPRSALSRLAALTLGTPLSRGTLSHSRRCRRALLLSRLGTGAALWDSARTLWPLAGG